MIKTNFLVIGSGISGLNFALQAAKKGKVTLVTKKKIIDSSTNFAQGGIAAILDKTDNIEQHVKDTLEAGAYHNNKKSVEFMVEKSTDAIYRLIDLGVKFEKEKGELKLTQEGGHHKRRIAYIGDHTGQEIEKILVKRVKEHLNITILEDSFALELVMKNKTCYGAKIIHKNKLENIFADQTILATGGIGQLFSNTTNPSIATGDGIAMAVNAGCKTKDMEFIQFHPSALAKKITPRFLISETVRGEGAKLINSRGERFMKNKHPMQDLAPRSIVAKEIAKQLENGPVFLDITHRDKNYLKKRFPKIYAKLLHFGIDMAKDKIPITPAAHYLCGGVVTDLHGHTNIKNLFAFGEMTYTGVHGANRLASNSLLEALVFSSQIVKKLEVVPGQSPPEQTFSSNFKLKQAIPISKNSAATKTALTLRTQIQKLMWKHAGIIRNLEKIKKEAIPQMEKILQKLSQIKATNQEIAETLNMTLVSLLILKAACKRKKSLGCHFVK
jgi:L-aspartate oxidase